MYVNQPSSQPYGIDPYSQTLQPDGTPSSGVEPNGSEYSDLLEWGGTMADGTGTLAETSNCFAGSCLGLWQGANGKWNDINLGGNGATGARSLALEGTSALEKFGTYATGASILINATQGYVAYKNKDTFGTVNAGVNIGVNVVGAFGPVGKSFAFGYAVGSLYVAPYDAPTVGDWICALAPHCLY